MTKVTEHPFPAAAIRQIRAYDETFVPAVFHPWASLLVGALAVEPGSSTLDVGTGPGTVARVLSACAGSSGSVVAVDINAAMLMLATDKPPLAGAAPIEYLECAAASLPLADGDLDVVTGQQVLQFVPDRAAALTEIRRVLKPGGRIGLITWTGLNDNPLFKALHDAVGEVLGAAAAVAFSEPWSLDGGETVALARAAGFTNVVGYRRSLPAIFRNGPDEVCRFYSFSAVRADIALLDERRRAKLHDITRTNLLPMTHAGEVHTMTTATLVLARAGRAHPVERRAAASDAARRPS